MTYRQRNRNKHRGLKIVGVIFAILLIMRFFNVAIVSNVFDGPANYVLQSNSVLLSPLKNTLAYFKSKKDLEAEVKRLQSENTELKIATLINQDVTQEFSYFKSRFGQVDRLDNTFKVILRPPFTPFDMIRISGNLQNHREGDFVFFDNILIGRITHMDDRYATVELFSSPDRRTPVSVKGVQFEAKGLGGGRYVFEAAKDFEVAAGDPVVYPEQSVMVLGAVEFVESQEEDLFKKVYFNLPASLDRISYVSVGMTQTIEQSMTEEITEQTDEEQPSDTN